MRIGCLGLKTCMFESNTFYANKCALATKPCTHARPRHPTARGVAHHIDGFLARALRRERFCVICKQVTTIDRDLITKLLRGRHQGMFVRLLV